MFIENVGQFDPGARFMVRGGQSTLLLADDTLWFTVLEATTSPTRTQQLNGLPAKGRVPQAIDDLPRRGVNLKVSFPGANTNARIEPFNRLDTKVSYFIGNDSTKWQTDVPVWGGVRYVDFYPGVDLEITGEQGQLAQRLVLQQSAVQTVEVQRSRGQATFGANVRLRVEGADSLALEGDSYRLTTAVGKFRLPLLSVTTRDGTPYDLPNAEPATNGNEITAPFASRAVGQLSSHVPHLASPLLLSPPFQTDSSDLAYSTFLGVVGDVSTSIAVDAAGNAYVTGNTYSSDFPTTVGAFDTSYNGGYDAFVVKLNSNGNDLVYSTFLGWGDGTGIAVDAAGNAYVTGIASSDFPTTAGAFDTSYDGGTGDGYVGDSFMVKLNENGSGLVYSTFLGEGAHSTGIAIDAAGNAYVTGNAYSSNFPITAGAFDTSYDGNYYDAFVVKLNGNGSDLTYSTFLGEGAHSTGIAVDAAGNAYVTGRTSSDFPTTAGAFDTSYDGNYYDTFVVKLNGNGSDLTYSTFLGEDTDSTGIAIDAAGNAYVTGRTYSSDFPTTPGAFDTSFNPGFEGDEAFVVKLNNSGNALIYSTFLRKTDATNGTSTGIAVDAAGNAYVTGRTYFSDFPTTPDAFDTSFNGGGYDVFVAKLNSNGSGLVYSTFLGGTNGDLDPSIAIDTVGNAYVTGRTYSSDFPTTPGAFDTSLDAPIYTTIYKPFVTKLALGNSISGQVTATATGDPLSGVVVSAGGSLSATTQADGRYTITKVISGTYGLTPTLAGYAFDPVTSPVTVITRSVTGVDFEGIPQRYSISGQVTEAATGDPLAGVVVSTGAGQSGTTDDEGDYTIANIPAGAYHLSLTYATNEYEFSPINGSTFEVELNEDKENWDFEGTRTTESLTPLDPVPDNHPFKGANWLLYDGIQDYPNQNVGWNLDMSGAIVFGLPGQITGLKVQYGVFTIIRLDNTNPAQYFDMDVVEASDFSCADHRVQQWMESVDKEVEGVTDKLGENPDMTPIFILGNEPNHFRDEWNYSGKAYARLFNCYYAKWRGEDKRPYALYAAGPGHNGPCEDLVTDGNGKATGCLDDPLKTYEQFYPEFFDHLHYADGFALHAYGYEEADNPVWDQWAGSDVLNSNFTGWLWRAAQALNNAPAANLKELPVMITEYNPGALAGPSNDNLPHEDWPDWFAMTHCWMTADPRFNLLKIRGALYFADGTNEYRSSGDNQWDETSLTEHRDRRADWLQSPVSNDVCLQRPVDDQSQQVQQNSVPAALSATTVLSGVISGTVGSPLDFNVYTVSGDLTVPAGETLTLESGTTLAFEPGAVMTVAGKLIANGNPVYPVRLINDSDGWGGLRFLPSAAGSVCNGCLVQNIEPWGTAVQSDAPITIAYSTLRGGSDRSSTAITASTPFTLTNSIIDYFRVGLNITVPVTTPFTVSHLTFIRNQTAVENWGAHLTVENSIISGGGIGLTTRQTGVTTLRYSLLHELAAPELTYTGGVYIAGPGVLTGTQRFGQLFENYPDSVRLKKQAEAVNTADPSADYSQEPGYNGGRADMGAYGNTTWATQRPPVEQMGISLQSDRQVQSAHASEEITWTVRLKNEGSITDSFTVRVWPTTQNHLTDRILYGSLFSDHTRFARAYTLAPQENVTFTVYGWFRDTAARWIEPPILKLEASNYYDVWTREILTATLEMYQEENGVVVPEAEEAAWGINTTEPGWLTGTTISGYSGTGYVQAWPDVDRIYHTNAITAAPSLVYPLNFTTTGVYTVWLRGYAPNGAGDSVHVGLDEKWEGTLTGFAPRQWSWANANMAAEGQAVVVNVTQPGVHTLKLWQGEDGLRLDRLLLTTNEAYLPTGDGPPESQIR